jgi:excinuclease ABC subunit C
MTIQEKIKVLPNKPGVYQFKDTDGKIIYIGKAKGLRNRVGSYFNKGGGHSGKTRVMIKHIRDFSFIVVESELDALLLENNLIKEHQPRYNALLKDDKTFPWICIKNERFPRVFSTRTKIEDGSEYFGPYASVKTMRTLLNLIRQLYKIRTCKYNLSQENIEAGKFKVCLEYHIGNCLGPCEGFQSHEDYLTQIDQIKSIIKGKIRDVISVLEERMVYHSKKLEFEAAQTIKEKLEILKRYQAKSAIVNPSISDTEVFTVVADSKNGYVNYMKVVDGAIILSRTLTIKKKLEESNQDLLALAISEIKSKQGELSKSLLISEKPDFEMEGYNYIIPQRGDKKKLVDLSLRNAKYFMLDRQKQSKFTNPEEHNERILNQIKDDLRLNELPRHIECFDNSNFQGTNAVAACVVFKNAKPSKKDYRHFNIKTVEGPDDYASMREVVFRRYRRLQEEGASLPQLVVIDGGKGQLSSAVESLEQLGLRGKIAVVGIAKRLEEIYYPEDPLPLHLDKTSETLRVLQHLRNEAHRFGITHHRNKRSKSTFKTALQDIPGVGKATSEKLLSEFKSVKRIREASKEDLANLIGDAKAEVVKKWLEKTN